MQTILLYVTVKNKSEATQIAAELLAERLVACANILPPVTSLYHWQGELQQEEEVILLAKTTAAAQQQAIDRIAALHSYDCPCILAFAPETAHIPFAQWIFSEIGD